MHPPAPPSAHPPHTLALFGPHALLAKQLLSITGEQTDDGSHDLSHLLRVGSNAMTIANGEPQSDRRVLTAAVMLHDCVAVEKNSPLRAQASRLAAARARAILSGLDWAAADISGVAHAIEAHSFSAAITPETLEARILQDADRLDAIGAIGIARCFHVGGRMGSRLYDAADPAAAARPLDDQRYALDHFAAKLFTVADGFQTATGRALAADRARTMRDFVDAMLREIGHRPDGDALSA